MFNPTIDFLLTVILGPVIAGGLGAFITHRLLYRKFISEKWWETKSRTYNEIIVSLVVMSRIINEWASELENQMNYPNFPGRDKKERQQIREEYKNAFSIVKQKTIEGEFIISNTASRILSQFQDDFRKDNDPQTDMDIWDNYIESRKTIDEHLNKFKVEARKDLKI